MEFKNKQGKDIKAALPFEIVNQVCDLMESDFKLLRIPYKRDGSTFYVTESDMQILEYTQLRSTLVLVEKNIITTEMLVACAEAEEEANFKQTEKLYKNVKQVRLLKTLNHPKGDIKKGSIYNWNENSGHYEFKQNGLVVGAVNIYSANYFSDLFEKVPLVN